LPESDAIVTEGGGYVALENAGRITTQISMPTSYEIYGSFLMANNPFSNFKVVLRTDGVTVQNQSVYGIEVQLNIQDDPAGGGSTTDNLKIYAQSPGEGVSIGVGSPTANLTLNTWHTFLITDNGYNINLFFDGATTPNLSAQSTYSAGNLVSFFNRQGGAAGSSISANGITELNEIQITETPEPSSLAMIAVGIFSLIGMRKGKR